jgi:thioredoxin 1
MQVKRITKWMIGSVLLTGLLLVNCVSKPPQPKTRTPNAVKPPASLQPTGSVEDVAEGDFDVKVLQSNVPVLVDFWAPWCGPCRTQGPIVEAVGAKFAGKLKIVKINVDSAKVIAGRYQIVSIPTLIVFKAGKVILNRTGLTSEVELTGMIEKLL